jgi:hypothetical protein
MPQPHFSDADYARAWQIYWTAARLADAHGSYQRGCRTFSVPPHWTAWLLMDKAGVPRPLIAHSFNVPETHLNSRLRAAKLLLMWAPYAARIEALMDQVPDFAPALEAACAG